MLELYSLQKVLWCKDRKKIENHGFKIELNPDLMAISGKG